jgi:hypothetical protein
LFRDA